MSALARARPVLHEILVSHLVGGAAVVALRLSAAAKARGWRAVAWVPGEGPAAETLDRAQVERRWYDLPALKGSAAPRLVACSRLAAGLFSLRPPLVHVHNPTVFGLLRPALMASRARVVVHFQIEPAASDIEVSFPTLKYPCRGSS